MNKVSKKIFSSIVAMGCFLTLTGCKTSLEKYNGTGGTAGNVIQFNHYDGIGTLDYDRDPMASQATINKTLYFINDANMGVDASTQTHVIGYQVTYTACNCRSASFNAATQVYIELSATQAALDDAEKATIQKIVFEGSAFLDDYEHETSVGHWGDSPVMDRNNNKWASEYVKSHGYKGASKQDFYDEIVPLLKGVSNEELNGWIDSAVDEEGVFHHEEIEAFENNTVDRYAVNLSSAGEIMGYSSTTQKVSINDAFAGASVSLDNLLSLIDSLFDYHKKELNKIKTNPSYAPFYSYDDTGFQGNIVVEASTDRQITKITGAQLAEMTEGAYLIYAASEGCASCAKFQKPAKAYVEKIGHKVYEVLFTEASEVYPTDLNGLSAPQFFLINDGRVVAMMSASDIAAASDSASYKVIYDNFTKALLSPTTR